MNPNFRERVLFPVLLPLGALIALGLFAISLSRVLLAVPEAVATLTALFIAGYVLLVAALVASRPRISSRALGLGLVVGLVAVVVAGGIGTAAGIRPIEHEEEEEEVADEAPEGEAVADIPDDAYVWVSIDNEFPESPESIPAGEVTVALDNQGNLLHNVVFEELGDQLLVEAEGQQTAVETVTLEPGTYTYYCDVPGHRPTMEGQVTVEG